MLCYATGIVAQSPPTHFNIYLCFFPTKELAPMIQSTTFDGIPDEILATCLIFLGAQDLLERSVQVFSSQWFINIVVSSGLLNIIDTDFSLLYQMRLTWWQVLYIHKGG